MPIGLRGRSRRLAAGVAIVASIALTATGCGGSSIESAGSAPDTAVADTTTTDAAPAVADDAQAPVTADVNAPAAVDEVAKPGDNAVTPGETVVNTPAEKATGKGAGKKGPNKPQSATGPNTADAPAAPSAAQTPVEKAIATLPIFGNSKTVCKPATLSEVPIGNVSTLSGVLGEVLSPSRGALEIFAASQNACGGLNGHKIKLLIEDDQGDPTTAAVKAQGLIQKGILAFIGNTQVLTVDATVPVIKKAGVPVIGGDLTSNTWFTNPLFFPQGSGGQSVAYGYLVGAVEYHKKKVLGDIWCIEVPRACQQVDKAFVELAPQFGAKVVKAIQASLTQPSYVQQCLDFKSAGVEVLAMTFDAASQNRVARSCEQVGFFPKVVAYPLAVGNEKQFLGNDWLGDTYIPMNHFPWMDNSTPVTKYYQTQVNRYSPGFVTGGAASLAWNAGALLVAASAGLSAENPTSQQLIDTLVTFKGQKFTELGGLTGPLTFVKDGNPQIPYCLFGAISNKENTGWAKVISKPTCTDVVAPSDPQFRG